MKEILESIRKRVIELVEIEDNAQLSVIVDKNLPNPLPSMVLLPFASGKALGVKTSELTETAAYIILFDMALRIVDDCADQDNPYALYKAIGVGRAMNLAMLLTAISSQGFSAVNALRAGYHSSLKQVCIGQEYDMSRSPIDLSDYSRIVSLKTIAAYRYAFLSGVLLHAKDDNTLDIMTKCGEHLGWMAQILDDIEALWYPLANNPIEEIYTFPVFYGLEKDHDRTKELKALLQESKSSREDVCFLLDQMNVRNELMGIALNHRDEALRLLGEPFAPEGATILKTILDWFLRDAHKLLENTKERSSI